MLERSSKFFKLYGPVMQDGFDFYPDGYTSLVTSGDGGYLTKDTLWDFKVSVNRPNSKHTLQLLMYWIMGKHSGKECFRDIDRVGVFNPRLNEVYVLDICSLPRETIERVEKEVIGY